MSEQAKRTRGRRHFLIDSAARKGPDWMRLALLASPGLARLHRLREAVRRLEDPVCHRQFRAQGTAGYR